ncbi:mechanosensitive ion channel family protein [Hyalangium rubrum]|uniref:Mechanosensitive ion channel family protein n=1 Tax=Hyalangium rubrum TaxID=3103134 RepID=A0ABU5H557_9BACT|nr:mechanosensitive ion channel family protein [Hyalangium sp. s54d21]MDY7227215.1 mechanosensitive ion channel family protein [Hyalangium sp. s54d21]
MNFDVNALTTELITKGTSIGLKLLGALALWIIGGWVAGMAVRLVRKGMDSRKLDATIARYVESALGVLLKVVLVVAILGYFGLETTSFAAVLAAAGIAIGTAWSGMLSHYAAGIFMVVLRPFKVGDSVTAGGVSGTVEEIGLFTTTINTGDNVRTFVGNNKIFSDTIQNFSANPHRRVLLEAQLAHGDDHRAAIKTLQEKLAQIPNVKQTPAPDVFIQNFTLAGPVLAVRPCCHNDHFGQVSADTNLAIRESGFSVPETHSRVISAVPAPASRAA